MEIYALVGKSGTGKSYKSHIVAGTYEIEYVIDDGLLIQGAKIIAGVSAKREKTKFGAVRRAIFKYEKHREEVRQAILHHAPSKLLIIGTSEHMIQSIIQALELTESYTIIRIEEISTPEEIEIAYHNRKIKGKHVIPVPTFEIKKAFSGYFIDSIKQWTRRNDKNPSGIMAENQMPKTPMEVEKVDKEATYRQTTNPCSSTDSTSSNNTNTTLSVSLLSSSSSATATAIAIATLPVNVTIAETTVVRPTFSYLGNFEIKDAAVKAIVEESTTEVEGIFRVNSVELKNQIDGIKIYINVTLKLKNKCETSIPMSINKMATAIKRNIEHMTGFNVLEINTTVKALLFQAEV